VTTSDSTPEVTVAEAGWRQVLPDLPDDVIEMLATPVVVTAEALEAAAPTKPEAPRAGIRDCTPTFLAPAPPKRMRARHRFA
jgi:hypothetical protein